MEPVDEWSTDANEALTLSLHSSSSGKQLSGFHPKYTYPIFGESETIFGYRDLNVRLAFASDDMAPCVDVSWTEQKKPVGEVVAEDVVEILKEYLPAGKLLRLHPQKDHDTDIPTILQKLSRPTLQASRPTFHPATNLSLPQELS